MTSASASSFADTRKAAVAGMFYPGNAAALSAQVNGYLNNVKAPATKEKIITLIVPHAGYDYSGQVAAYAYKQLEGRHYNNVIIIGASHNKAFGGIAVSGHDSYETPLGKVAVDKEALNKLMAMDKSFVIDNSSHDPEHSIEVQLPFLQTVLKDFKITPLLFGSVDPQLCINLADDLFKIADDNTLVVISTDLSHYYDHDKAVKLDTAGIELILKDDPDSFLRGIAQSKTEACGAPAVLTGMLYSRAKGANESKLLNYANSGDVTGDKSRVVGYASIAFMKAEGELNMSEQAALLKLARTTLENHYNGTEKKIKADTPALLRKSGAFVTLTENDRLRGCIGYIQAIEPLNKAVERMAMAAALEDRRFMPVTKDEVPKLHIEISVLSPMKRINDTSEIKVGRDGLYLIARGHSGVFLPQVPGDYGWDLPEYLRQICGKAGLPDDAWKDKDAQLYTFTAQVFGE